mmetsp:Transcript_51143/g.116463  ORF Transcript_51143/g.116463 Transcript_51143/m.116463 type:complete len:110 (-) Transcript_51143:97-426(-)
MCSTVSQPHSMVWHAVGEFFRCSVCMISHQPRPNRSQNLRACLNAVCVLPGISDGAKSQDQQGKRHKGGRRKLPPVAVHTVAPCDDLPEPPTKIARCVGSGVKTVVDQE